MKRTLTIVGATAVLLLAVPTVALAQEEPVPESPVAECGFLSAVVCQVNVDVDVGPFGPFTFFPNGLGSPPPPPS